MAKETEKVVKTNSSPAAKVKDGEVDICAEIDANVRMSAEVAKKAAEEIAAKNEKRRVDEMTECLQKADYIRQASLLTLRKSRDEEKANKAFLATLTNLEKELKEGEHDTSSYDKVLSEARKLKKEGYTEAAKKFDDYMNKLSQNFAAYNTWRWQQLINSNF